MKLFWKIIAVPAALAAGLFLYEWGVLFFRYRDFRQGFLVLAAAAVILYFGSVYMGWREK